MTYSKEIIFYTLNNIFSGMLMFINSLNNKNEVKKKPKLMVYGVILRE